MIELKNKWFSFKSFRNGNKENNNNKVTIDSVSNRSPERHPFGSNLDNRIVKNSSSPSTTSAKETPFNPESANRITKLCELSLKEVTTAKQQMSQIAAILQKNKPTEGEGAGGNGEGGANSSLNWLGGAEKAKKIDKFNSFINAFTDAIGKIEALLQRALKLTRGLSRTSSLGLGSTGSSQKTTDEDEES